MILPIVPQVWVENKPEGIQSSERCKRLKE